MKAPAVQLFDSNFEGLLREAAAAPRSMLLRVERPQVFAALRSREAPASVAMAGLSSVERELLASYRAELGFLLRQATIYSLTNDEKTGSWIDPTIADRKLHHLPTREELNAAAASHLDGSNPSSRAETAAELEYLRDLLSSKCSAVSTPEIAAAALRVEALDQPRIYMGAYFAALGESTKSVDVLRFVLDGRASAGNEAFALEGTALAFGRAGKFTDAARSMKAAVALDFPRPELPMRYLLYSALAGDRSDIVDAMHAVEELVPENHPSIDHVCDVIGQQVHLGVWCLPAESSTALQHLGRRTGCVSNRILNELAPQPTPIK